MWGACLYLFDQTPLLNLAIFIYFSLLFTSSPLPTGTKLWPMTSIAPKLILHLFFFILLFFSIVLLPKLLAIIEIVCITILYKGQKRNIPYSFPGSQSSPWTGCGCYINSICVCVFHKSVHYKFISLLGDTSFF